MKKNKFYMLVVLAMLSTSCDKDDDNDGPNKMTFITQHTTVTMRLAGTGTATIDWGDKSKTQTYSLREFEYASFGPDQGFNHTYSGLSTHTITITGENVTHLSFGNSLISHLDVSRNKMLEYLMCSFNPLTHLDVSKNTKLQSLFCSATQITSFDVSNNAELTVLSCGAIDIVNLDVSKNTKLTYLECFRNPLLEYLDVSNNTNLQSLRCHDSQLRSLIVRGLANLEYLECGSSITNPGHISNHLTSLDVSGCSSLTYLKCESNLLTADALNDLFETLNDTMVSNGKDILITNNPGTNDCDRRIAENKGWYVTDSTIE